MPVYEIASWTGSDALISDKDILKPAFDEMSKTEGYIRYVNFFSLKFVAAAHRAHL